MRIIDHGKVSYVLGLKWTETDGGDPQAHLRDLVGAQRCVFQAMGKRRHRQPVGYTTDVEPFVGKKKAANPVSLVAAVLALGQDGVYLYDLDDGHAWLCIVHQGKVLSTPEGAESVLPTARATTAATQIARNVNVPIRSNIEAVGNESFSIDVLPAKGRKLPGMRVSSASNNLVGGLVLAAVVAGIGYGAWTTFADQKPKGSSAAVLAEQERQAYASSVTASIPALDQDPAWILDAYRMAETNFPSLVEGWSLTKVACEPAMCTGVYEIAKQASVYSFEGLKERFGAHRVRLVQGQEQVNISIERESSPRIWSAEEILDPVRHPMDLVDLHGLLRVRVPQVKVEPGFSISEIDVGPRPVLVRPMTRELIVTNNSNRASASTVGAQVEVMGDAGFVPVALLMNQGDESTAGWRIEWVRINGAVS
ncbi:type 4b pilus protein PilO2 [Luteimonas sp. MHLX1A]|uniref:type 4b pilus protein PilO2 n=1 Tax=Alterluteimonas muca TaxID=2878684 RepID=UPI001E407780|nr:type 4b pilus protein PilO2 [Luteimonas sp. MHLX1A]MCD9046737.1 type 4b pilus protein PilO2 [Luteimonas sp. MHLX1A]